MRLNDWMRNKSRLIWMQPDALLTDITVDGLEAIVVPRSADGVVFIWDMVRLQALGFGHNRLAFLYQALEELAQLLEGKFLVIEGDSRLAVETLLKAGIQLKTVASPNTQDLQVFTQALQTQLGLVDQVEWDVPRDWIAYPRPLPNGFFKFWKAAEKQLFSGSSVQSFKSAKHRPHQTAN